MLGYLLYESVEMVYYISKFTYSSMRNTYNWYYNIRDEPYNNTMKIIQLEHNIMLITNKYNELEKKLEYQNQIISNTNINNQKLLTYEN